MLALFDADTGTFDLMVAIAGCLFVIAAFLSRPVHDANTPVRAYNWTIAFVASAVVAFAFLFMTP
jgi:hypothetical protein